jgi:excisionase family DNA binding protein
MPSAIAADLEVFTIAEAALVTKQSRRTIERRLADGTLEKKKVGPHDVRITGESLRSYLAGGPAPRTGTVTSNVTPLRKGHA